MYRFVLFLCLVLPLPTLAETLFFEPERGYALEQVTYPDNAVSVYGELIGWPQTWRFTIASTTAFVSQLRVADSDLGVSQILVREEDRGVKEVVRQNGRQTTWNADFDSRTGTLLESAPVMRATITPGSYRLEINTPDNQGRYYLLIGEVASRAGWRATFAEAWQANAHFGSLWGGVRATAVWVPIVLLVGIWVIWRYRKRHA